MIVKISQVLSRFSITRNTREFFQANKLFNDNRSRQMASWLTNTNLNSSLSSSKQVSGNSWVINNDQFTNPQSQPKANSNNNSRILLSKLVLRQLMLLSNHLVYQSLLQWLNPSDHHCKHNHQQRDHHLKVSITWITTQMVLVQR